MIRLLVCLLILALPVGAETVVLGLSRDQVAITATFDGSDILIFGAVKREAPAPEDPLDVVIAISGPSEPVAVRRKDRRFGIWINTRTVNVDHAPSYYAVVSTRPLSQALSHTEDLRHRITLDRAIRAVGITDEAADAQSFVTALKRIGVDAGRYVFDPQAVALDQQTLFRTALALPANLTEGDYSARIFLTRNGQVVDHYQTHIAVKKVGLERWLYTLSQDQPLLYGLLSLVIAVSAGWAASAGFTLLLRR